jgi:LysM repeat protein
MSVSRPAQKFAASLVIATIVQFLLTTVAPVHAQQSPDTHVVLPGENLSTIALQYNTDTETLRQLNSLGDADLIWVGLPLKLPTAGTPAAQAPTVSAPLAGDEIGVYVVKPGDTLSSIAAAHRTGLARLVELNRISPAARPVPGKQLRVPQLLNAEAAAIDENGLRIHVVKAGEHLGSIGERYTTTALKIAELNGLSNASLIIPGQQLLIPPPSFDELAVVAPIGEDGFHFHPQPLSTTEKWIDVDLSEQRVVAYEGATPVQSFIVSTGKENTPTVTGTFRIWAKTAVQDMFGGNRAAGDYYYLEDVEWVQYFYEDYGFHSAYWHDNFGEPMSRGCINMRTEDAEWLFEWAGPDASKPDKTGWVTSDNINQGTLVVVHD